MGAARIAADAPIVLADRLEAAAWRLAGARVVVIPDALPAAEVAAAFDAACESATRVVLCASCADRVPRVALARRVRGSRPVVVVAAPDVVRHARRVLGVGT